MKAQEILQVAVRLLGLAFVYHGLSELPSIITLLFAGSFGSLVISVLKLGWALLIAYWLLRGAPLIMRIAYPGPDPTPVDEVE